MPISNDVLTQIGYTLGDAVETAMSSSKPKVIALDIATAQSLFAITQELIAFRIDYPDVCYAKVIEDEFGARGEQ